MRVSILVNSGDPTTCHDYAVLWLDPARHVWLRQTCVGIALPPEGEILARGGATLLCAPDADAATLLTLGKFELDARQQLTSIFGTATWFSLTRNTNVDGFWHLRAVERSPTPPSRARRDGNRGGAQPPLRRDGLPGHGDCR